MVLTTLNPLQEEKRRSRHETKPKAAALFLLVILVFQSKASFAGEDKQHQQQFYTFPAISAPVRCAGPRYVPFHWASPRNICRFWLLSSKLITGDSKRKTSLPITNRFLCEKLSKLPQDKRNPKRPHDYLKIFDS